MSSVNDTIIPTGAVSLSSDWESESLLVEDIVLLSISLVFTGTPVGVFKLYCSNDRYSKANPPTNWTFITGSSISITEAGDHTWNIQELGFTFIKVVYTRTSGTGSLVSAQYTGKGV